MKINPKQLTVTLPIVLTFENANEIAKLAASINSIVSGKSKVKYDYLGRLGGNEIGILYLQRDRDFSELRKKFMFLIEQEEIKPLLSSTINSD